MIRLRLDFLLEERFFPRIFLEADQHEAVADEHRALYQHPIRRQKGDLLLRQSEELVF